MRLCLSCGASFSETKNTFLKGLRTPVSRIWKVLKARTEGMALNATCRVFKIAIKRLADLIEQTEDLTLVTDGERRYGKVLFEICHELLRTGKLDVPEKF